MTTIARPTSAPSPAPSRSSWRPARLVGPLIVVAALALCAACASTGGITVWQVGRALLAAGVTQVVPGALLWRCVRPRDGWLLEDVACGFALGVGMAVPAQVLGGTTGQRWPAVVVPLAVAAALLAVPRTRTRIVAAQWTPTPWWLGAGVALSSLVALPQLMAFVLHHPLRWAQPGAPQRDQHFHLALAGELLNRGPSGWPMVAGEDLGYHWFGHAWLAQICAASGLSVDQVGLRVPTMIMPVALAAAVAASALRLSGRAGVAVGAAVITMAGSRFSVWQVPSLNLPINPESFTLGLSALLLIATTTLLALRWRGHVTVGTTAALPALTALSAGTKGSTVPLLIAGSALAAVVLLARRRRLARLVLLDLALMVVALMVTMKVVFNGSAGALTFDPGDAVTHTFFAQEVGGHAAAAGLALSAVLMVVGGLTRAMLGFTLLARDSDRDGRRDPVTWLLLGASVAGCSAPVFLVQPGGSQYYFLISAYPLGAVASALAAGAFVRSVGRRTGLRVAVIVAVTAAAAYALPVVILRPLRAHGWTNATLVICCAATIFVIGAAVVAACTPLHVRRHAAAATLAATVLATGLASVAHSLTHPGAIPNRAEIRDPGATSQGQIDSARYIRDRSGRHDLVATNRHCAAPGTPVCESRRFLVAAYSERQVLLEGWAYTPTISALSPEGRTSLTHPFWDPALQRLNDGFFVAPTAAARDALWAKGVRWVYVDNLFAHRASFAPYATRRFAATDGTSSAWQLLPPG